MKFTNKLSGKGALEIYELLVGDSNFFWRTGDVFVWDEPNGGRAAETNWG